MTATDGRPAHDLHAIAVRHVLLALSRFGKRVRRVTVHMATPDNALGGVDQHCQMRAWLELHDAVRAEAINGRIESAIARAATRLATRVAFALEEDAGDAPADGATRPKTRRRSRGKLAGS